MNLRDEQLRDAIAAIIGGNPGRTDIAIHALYHSQLKPKADEIIELLMGRMPEKVAYVTCPQCRKPFVLTWRDYSYDPAEREINNGKLSTLIVRGCPSGGIYDVEIHCPHCNYEEPL